MQKIYLGADHAGFKLKEKLKNYFTKKKIPINDLGAVNFDPEDDYPDYAFKVAIQAVKNKSLGILICGTGLGMCLAANKVKGARATFIYNEEYAKQSREHLNSNILCLAGNLSFRKAKKIIEIWLNTKFSQITRHKRRLKKIFQFEKQS